MKRFAGLLTESGFAFNMAEMRTNLPENLREPGAFWRWNLVLWLILGALGFMVRYAIYSNAGLALLLTVWQEPIGFGITCLMWLVYRRPCLGEPFQVATAAIILSLSLVAAVLQSAWLIWVIGQFDLSHPDWSMREEWLLRIIYLWLLYMIWGLAWFWGNAQLLARHEGQRARKAAHDAELSELRLLRTQLDPHFLFNALNSAVVEMEEDPARSRAMIHELSAYLRYSLDYRDRILAPLSAELNAVQAYLRIENVRFSDRLKTDVIANPAARAVPVPSFLLQPLVENAVRHGFVADVDQWELRVRADAMDGGTGLAIAILNRGELLEQAERRDGVGLSTLRRRLQLHYPGRHRFELSQEDGWVKAELILEGLPCSG